MSPTAIRDVRFFTARSTLSRPIADATHAISGIRFVVAGIELANGVTGQSHLLAFHDSPHAIAGACRDLEAFLRGRDVCDTEAVIRDWDTESEYFGHAGVNRWALGLANLAMWDARGKVARAPVWKLLGGQVRDKVRAYNTDIGWLSIADDKLVEGAKRAVADGFTGIKIKVGSTVERDLRRLEAVRKAIGPDVTLAIDGNGKWDLPTCLRFCRGAEPHDVYWFE